MKASACTLTRNLKPLVDAGWVELAAGTDALSRLMAIKPAGCVKRVLVLCACQRHSCLNSATAAA